MVHDGAAGFVVMDMRVKALVDIVYPVGVVIGVDNDDTPAFTKYGTWEKIAASRVLQGSDDEHSAGTTIEAGLPNITGTLLGLTTGAPNGDYAQMQQASGAFYKSGEAQNAVGVTANQSWNIYKNGFNASMANIIYGSSDTVQPPAYVVNFWHRIA